MFSCVLTINNIRGDLINTSATKKSLDAPPRQFQHNPQCPKVYLGQPSLVTIKVQINFAVTKQDITNFPFSERFMFARYGQFPSGKPTLYRIFAAMNCFCILEAFCTGNLICIGKFICTPPPNCLSKQMHL